MANTLPTQHKPATHAKQVQFDFYSSDYDDAELTPTFLDFCPEGDRCPELIERGTEFRPGVLWDLNRETDLGPRAALAGFRVHKIWNEYNLLGVGDYRVSRLRKVDQHFAGDSDLRDYTRTGPEHWPRSRSPQGNAGDIDAFHYRCPEGQFLAGFIFDYTRERYAANGWRFPTALGWEWGQVHPRPQIWCLGYKTGIPRHVECERRFRNNRYPWESPALPVSLDEPNFHHNWHATRQRATDADDVWKFGCPLGKLVSAVFYNADGDTVPDSIECCALSCLDRCGR